MTSTSVVEVRELSRVERMAPQRDGTKHLALQIIDRMAQKQVGEGIEFSIPDSTKGSSLRSYLTQLAIDNGFSVTTRFSGDNLLVWKIEKPRSSRTRRDQRLDEIVARRISGETLESIASDLRITRERVRQIEARGYRTFANLPVGDRHAAVLDFLKPYLDATPDDRTCFMCGQVIGEGHFRRFGICVDCRKTVNVVSDVAAWLRMYKKDNSSHIGNAILLIKRHQLTPDDLKRG